MTAPDNKSSAVVVLPAVRRGRLSDRSLRGWLSRADLRSTGERQATLAAVLDVLGMEPPASGLAALRMWGQTRERPTVWLAGADPVYLEPRLDHLCVHALGGEGVSVADLRGLFDHLQATLAPGSGYGFARIGRFGYLRCAEPVATAAVPAIVADLDLPNAYLPTGEPAETYRRLVGEIEMALHDHEVNVRRQATGLPPVNSLWLWGGGHAPEVTERALPPLFAEDPLAAGYWQSCARDVAPWPGSIGACAETAGPAFVAIPPCPAEDTAMLESCLRELRVALRERRLDRLVLIFRDGLEATLRRRHAVRLWRREYGALA